MRVNRNCMPGHTGCDLPQDFPHCEKLSVIRAAGLSFPACALIMVLAVVQTLSVSTLSYAQDRKTVAKVAPSSVARVANSKLPASVQDMREAILAAVSRADIEEMRIALEWNELRPELGIDRHDDAIETWRRNSSDGNGLQILAILGDILAGAPARVPLGRDVENNDVFVWPYIAELDLKKLTPAQTIELYRMVPPKMAKEIVMTGTWTWYRLAIGADGTWHVFAKDPTKKP